MAAATAWVLNLDADLELAAGARYAPRRAVLEAMRPHRAHLAAALLGLGDVLLDLDDLALRSHGDGERVAATGRVGRAFCPTPRALAILRSAGAEPEPHPSFEVLRLVNGRAFASSLGPTIPGAAFVTDLEVARAMLAGAPPLGDGWRLKRAFGMAGRGQRRVSAGPMAAGELAFVCAALGGGGVQIEPNLAIEREYALHGRIDPGGGYRLGAVVRQRCDRHGAWLATEPLGERAVHGEVPDRLEREAERVAVALAQAGYFGPFGIDAFTYRDGEGRLVLQPRSEINARYSMGFAVGFGRG